MSSSLLLVLPDAYGLVERNVYRSAALQPASYAHFKHVKTVLLLSPEAPTKSLLSWMDDNRITLVHLGYQQLFKFTSSWRPVSEELVKEGLELILNADTHPILIMCTSGVQETGTLIGCLRKLQGWNFNSIIVEYRSFAGNKSRYVNEQFIELFDLDLVTLPKNLPSWFTDHQRLLKEETENAHESARRALAAEARSPVAGQ
ncbi:tyrosine phosphatase family-domain-containing protein [Entophlyctis helioformis]|nr:tyrosine phosphatase family-domain-containing protein [Entophlyctis helioformis]